MIFIRYGGGRRVVGGGEVVERGGKWEGNRGDLDDAYIKI